MTTKIKGDANALKLAQQALSKVDGTAKAAAEAALQKAAGSDGNRYLSEAEAKLAADAFEAAKKPGAALLGKTEVDAATDNILRAVASKLGVENLDGITTSFTSRNDDLEAGILNGLDQTVAAANGRRVDVDVMIFQFQSQPIADKILTLCKENPNLHVRVIADFSQTAESTTNQLPRMAQLAQARTGGLPNLDIRFKKDNSYVWDPKAGRAVYSHNSTRGLNHHKGFVATIDGKPYKLMMGSFNWSKTANKSNYEDLLDVDATKNDATEKLARDYLSEFTAFFNREDTLTYDQARAFKTSIFNDLKREHGQTAPANPAMPAGGPAYDPGTAVSGFDVNSFSTEDVTGVAALVGNTVAGKLMTELRVNGRFDSLDELRARIPEIGRLAKETQAKLATLTFGDGQVSLNVADVAALVRAGFGSRQASTIVAERQKNGDFQSVAEVASRTGIPASTLTRLGDRVNVADVDAFFTSRGYDDKASGTGYAKDHANATVAVEKADGSGATQEKASVTSALVDMFRRARPGEIVRIAMYGISPNTPEFQEMMAANKRGVQVRLIVNDGYNDPAIDAVKLAIKNGATGLQMRIQTAKTLHTKFGVVNDDVFTGSANFSGSSSDKHSEDRFVLRNQPEAAVQYINEFENIWAKSKDLP